MSSRMPSSFHGGADGVSEVRKRSRRNRMPVPVPLLSVRVLEGWVGWPPAEPISMPPLNEK